MPRLPRGGLTPMDALALSAPRRLTVPIDNRWGGGEMAVLDFGDPARPVDLVFVHANGFITPLVGVGIKEAGAIHLARWTNPIQCKRQCGPTCLWS